MNARALGVIVTGGRHCVVSVEDCAFPERTLLKTGAKQIHTDGCDRVEAQVETWVQQRGVSVWRVAANWMHDCPATPAERNVTPVELAAKAVAFPGDAATPGSDRESTERPSANCRKPGPPNGLPSDHQSAVSHLATRTAPVIRNFTLNL